MNNRSSKFILKILINETNFGAVTQILSSPVILLLMPGKGKISDQVNVSNGESQVE